MREGSLPPVTHQAMSVVRGAEADRELEDQIKARASKSLPRQYTLVVRWDGTRGRAKVVQRQATLNFLGDPGSVFATMRERVQGCFPSKEGSTSSAAVADATAEEDQMLTGPCRLYGARVGTCVCVCSIVSLHNHPHAP